MTLEYKERYSLCSDCGRDRLSNQFGFCAMCWTKLSEKQREVAGATTIVPQIVYVPSPNRTQLIVLAFVAGCAGGVAAALAVGWFL